LSIPSGVAIHNNFGYANVGNEPAFFWQMGTAAGVSKLTGMFAPLSVSMLPPKSKIPDVEGRENQ